MLDQARQSLRDLLPLEAYDALVTLAWTLFPFAKPGNLHWLFIASTVLVALALYLARRPSGGFVRFLVPRAVFLHPSAVLDYKFYVVNALLLTRLGAWIAMAIGLLFIADHTKAALDWALGPTASEPTLAARVGFTIALALAVDFGVFFAHYLEHKLPVLWAFHKVHHAPEVLTPITKYRFHPVDSLVDETCKLVCGGVVTGVYAHWFPAGITEVTLMSLSVISFVFFLQNHLRHSHIPLSFGSRLEHWLSSPVMHQIHHSAEPRHLDRNFGLMLSIWDRMFGTLYVPRGAEAFRLGLVEDDARLRSLWGLYTAPFGEAAKRIMQSVQPPGRAASVRRQSAS